MVLLLTLRKTYLWSSTWYGLQVYHCSFDPPRCTQNHPLVSIYVNPNLYSISTLSHPSYNASNFCFPLTPLGWYLWLFRCLSWPSEVRLAKLGILEHYNEDAAFIPKHLPLITLDIHSCKHKVAQITETITSSYMLANLHSKKVSLCPEEDSVQILKAE